MPKKEILYYESTGEINTEETLKIAKERAEFIERLQKIGDLTKVDFE